jgi:1,2-diacylglycerol 3-alpha-glucosyltransferase
MKVGLFTDTYRPQINGVVESVDTTAQFLRKRGHKVYIFAPKVSGYTDPSPQIIRLNSVRILKNPEERLAMPVPTKGFRDMLRLDLDVVHAHGGGTLSLLGYQLAVVRGLPFVFTYHTLYTEYLHYFLKGRVITPDMVKSASRVFCNLTDTVIAPSHKIEKELKSYGVTKPILVVPGGIDTALYQEKAGYLREKYQLPDEAKIILFTGRLGKEKNLRFLIQAFKEISLKVPNCYFFIVGDGPERKRLETQVNRNQLQQRVVFTGFLPRGEVPRVYADSDLFVFASQTETQGLVVAEALASGLPVVAVKDEAIGEMVVDGENGYLTAHNPTAFGSQVIRLLKDENLRRNFSKAAKLQIKKHFTADRQAETLETIYKTVQYEQKKNPRSVVRLTKKISSVYNFLNTASLVTVWKSLVRRF